MLGWGTLQLMSKIIQWFDSNAAEPFAPPGDAAITAQGGTPDWARIVPLLGLHGACLTVLWVGVSPTAVVVAVVSYLVRMFAITAFYHRYFAHRAFRTGRIVQFLFACLGAAATQRGPLWWAAHHRNHHRHVDTALDPHSPQHGGYWSHMGWFLSTRHFATQWDRIPEWAQVPELRWLDRYDIAIPIAYATGLYLLGEWLAHSAPGLQTSGWQLVTWGYVISTIVLLHVTLMVNSVAHRSGSRPFATKDASRNNWWLALLTLGEGWHNNHHRYAGAARQGFVWWEIDITYYVLRVMCYCGLVRDLRDVPAAVLAERR